MYGFPTQTEQETIDSLDVVMQLFERNCIQLVYWRQFTTTIHSPIGMNPQDFEINITGPDFEDFAQNDLWLEDPQGADHPKYTKWLNLALHNYLNRTGFNEEMQTWFEFPVPATSQPAGLIEIFLAEVVTTKVVS